jgi:uncharacterized integral membrane protein
VANLSSQPDPGPAESKASTPSKAGQAARQVGRGVRAVLLIAITVLATIFLLSNSQSVEVNYLFGTAQTPLFVALGLAMILGVLLTLAVVGILRVRRSGRK